MQKLILFNNQSPGDLVALTATLRDLHHTYPGRFVTDVRCHAPEIFQNNPHLTPLEVSDPEVSVVHCEYPAVQESNLVPIHFLQAFMQDLNQKLNLEIKPTVFRGDIHLSETERTGWPRSLRSLPKHTPYWIVAAGGKFDYTIKWWHFRRWQQVVDHFLDRVSFVQIGVRGDYHPPLRNVVDLRGRTDLRELIHLVHHSAGVLCPVTAVMHLAAAVEPRSGDIKSRPCVVVAGGREPVHWASYPTHQYVHTVGALDCCATGGCWRARIVPLNDGAEHDRPERLCVDVCDGLPRCMSMITPEAVIERIETYLS